MNTQNVNVKTAAQESSRKMGETPRMDGFVRNLSSANCFDVIRATSVIARMKKSANAVCGLYFEIYEYRLFNLVQGYLNRLPEGHKEAFRQAAQDQDIYLTPENVKRAGREYSELMNELATDY
jgi:hypothetical protein